LISLQAVRKTFPARSGAVEAVAGVSFDVAEGEFVSILGPSGCGKSTLLMMLAGLEPATSGELRIADQPVTGPRREAGLVFQDATLLPWLSARENVLFPVRMMRLGEARFAARADELLAMVGLRGFEDRRPRELSGGMRQRVALCRALIHDPKLLLMDEPFSALDAITRDEMAAVLLDLWERDHAPGVRRTGVFITHSIREAVLLSDRVLVMTRRPAVVVADIAVPFPRPRVPALQETPAFNVLVGELRSMIERGLSEAA
jgi:NitT/TauT family transport system ATP-binding protein